MIAWLRRTHWPMDISRSREYLEPVVVVGYYACRVSSKDIRACSAGINQQNKPPSHQRMIRWTFVACVTASKWAGLQHALEVHPRACTWSITNPDGIGPKASS